MSQIDILRLQYKFKFFISGPKCAAWIQRCASKARIRFTVLILKIIDYCMLLANLSWNRLEFRLLISNADLLCRISSYGYPCLVVCRNPNYDLENSKNLSCPLIWTLKKIVYFLDLSFACWLLAIVVARPGVESGAEAIHNFLCLQALHRSILLIISACVKLPTQQPTSREPTNNSESDTTSRVPQN